MNKTKIPFFCMHKRVIVMAIVFTVLIGMLSIYNYYNLRSKTDVENVDDLSGQRIATCVGWESDYLLSPREDITLLRYESNVDCILALSYDQVDAVAMDEITLNTVMQKTTGLEKLPVPITSVGCTFYVSYNAETALEEFNEFAKAFYSDPYYQEYHDKLFDDEYVMADVPELTEGKKLVVGYVPDSYPESYIDFNTGEPAGYGIEMMKRFAYAYGYKIEWVETSETGALIQLALNQIDFAACYVSDVYRADTELGGQAHMSEAYVNVDVYLIKVKEGEKLAITGEIDY